MLWKIEFVFSKALFQNFLLPFFFNSSSFNLMKINCFHCFAKDKENLAGLDTFLNYSVVEGLKTVCYCPISLLYNQLSSSLQLSELLLLQLSPKRRHHYGIPFFHYRIFFRSASKGNQGGYILPEKCITVEKSVRIVSSVIS